MFTFQEMNTFSILHLTLLVAIAIEASKTGDPLIDIIESEGKGNVNSSIGCQDQLGKPKVTEISARQASGDWIMIRQPDGNRDYIGEPLILDHMNIDVGYADFTKFAIKAYDQPPQLFMICDMKGMGLKLKDVRNEMSVKIMAQKSHFFNYNYLSGAYDDSTGNSYIWYDLLQPIGMDKKQEWIVQKDDANMFYFKHADRPNNFITGKDSKLLVYLRYKYGWDVQKFEQY